MPKTENYFQTNSLELTLTIIWDNWDKHESYCFISLDPKYIDGNKLLWSEMPSDVSEAVFKEIDWQLSEDVTWIEDVPEWEIVKIEPEA